MKLVYVAGPYTSSDPWLAEQHVRAAEYTGIKVMHAGFWPVIPHSNTRHYFTAACTYEQALEGTLEMLKRCDAAIFVPGWEASKGARAERLYCERVGMPVFDSIEVLQEWRARGAA
jgi:hypothetical protein